MARYIDEGPLLDKELLSQSWKSQPDAPTDIECDPRFIDGPAPLNCTLRDGLSGENGHAHKVPTVHRRSYHDSRKEEFEADAAKLQQMIDHEALMTQIRDWEEG